MNSVYVRKFSIRIFFSLSIETASLWGRFVYFLLFDFIVMSCPFVQNIFHGKLLQLNSQYCHRKVLFLF
jgi:hypothetical protein